MLFTYCMHVFIYMHIHLCTCGIVYCFVVDITWYGDNSDMWYCVLFRCRYHLVRWQQWTRQSSGWVIRTCMCECVVILSFTESVTMCCRWLVDLQYLCWSLPMACSVLFSELTLFESYRLLRTHLFCREPCCLMTVSFRVPCKSTFTLHYKSILA